MLAIHRIEPSGSLRAPPTAPVWFPVLGILAAVIGVGGFIYWNETRR